MFAAHEAGHQVGEWGGAEGSTVIDAALKPRFSVLQLPALGADPDKVGEGLPLRDLAMVLRPSLNDAIDGGRREAHGISEEAYELVKSKFREVRVGQGFLQQLQEIFFPCSFGQNGNGGHPGPKGKRRDEPLIDHGSLNLPCLSEPFITRK